MSAVLSPPAVHSCSAREVDAPAPPLRSPWAGAREPGQATAPGRPTLATEPSPAGNQLLARLPEETRRRWSAQLEPVELARGMVLSEPGEVLGHIYFPTTAVVSLLCVLENGSTAEIAAVGREGAVGVAVFMGGRSTPTRAVVQSAGRGFRLRAEAARGEFEASLPVLQLLLRYTLALMAQTAQTGVCNRYHSVEQQFCRWMLFRLDRAHGGELAATQELIAHMLGVRREGVTEVAGRLQREGLISYSRGHITVVDRRGLERRACECYGAVTQAYQRALDERVAG